MITLKDITNIYELNKNNTFIAKKNIILYIKEDEKIVCFKLDKI